MNPSGQNPGTNGQEGQSFPNDSRAVNSPITPTATPQTANPTASATLPGYQENANNIYTTTPAGMFPESAAVSAPAANAPEPTPQPLPQSDAATYLDSIASTTPTKNSFLSGKMLIVIGAAVVALIVVMIIAAVRGAQPSSRKSALALGTKLTDLQALIDYGQTNKVATTSLVKISAEANLIVKSHQYSLGKVFTLTEKKDDGKAPAKPDFIADLDSAKAQGNLDSVYEETLKSQFDSTYSALNDLSKQATGAKEQTAVNKTATDIKELYRRLTE